MEAAAGIGREALAASLFDDTAIVQYQDVVASLHGRQVVSDQHDRPSCHELVQGALDQGLGGAVQPGGWLVEDDHLRVPEEYPAQREELGFARRQSGPAGPQLRIESVGLRPVPAHDSQPV